MVLAKALLTPAAVALGINPAAIESCVIITHRLL